ncbi:MAG: aconitate hydratase, partial [bacterium]
ATIANMSPEYGATIGFFPVDKETLSYLEMTGRDAALVDLVERYCKEQNLFRTENTPDPNYSDRLKLDLGNVEPSLAGPRRPQDRVLLKDMRTNFQKALKDTFGKTAEEPAAADMQAEGNGVAVLEKPKTVLSHGAVVIAAITSCTNTSNPSVMVGAGLLAKKAVERGLRVAPWVKTSRAPGSKVVTEYLEKAGLLPYLEALRFHVVGYGCTTCIGNSGSLPAKIADEVQKRDLVAVAVLSGNRNFDGRINPMVKASYLSSPPLVVAYAIAGSVELDLTEDPLGYDPNGNPVYLKDIWPSQEEITDTIEQSVNPGQFRRQYAKIFDGDEKWRKLPVPKGDHYAWKSESTYIQVPPFFAAMPAEPPPLKDIAGARALAILGDSITTDHISPAGAITEGTPAEKYLLEHGVDPKDFNTYGSRRGNHEVMMRGTFANIRLRNKLVPQMEGGWTVHVPSGEKMAIYDAAMKYKESGVPLIVIGGKEYGSGSSRDWAAKGPYLLGVRAVIAESFERIHRSNLIGMGVLPLQFKPGENADGLGLSGLEEFAIEGIAAGLSPRKALQVVAKKSDGSRVEFGVIARVDSRIEIEYYRHGGILLYVLRKLLAA